MCFHIYAEKKKIRVVYASEHIDLVNGGVSDIIIDMVVQNCSDKEVKLVNVLYPKPFVNIKKNSEIRYLDVVKDLTHTILDPSNAMNARYGEYQVLPSPAGKGEYSLTLPLANHAAPHKPPRSLQAQVLDLPEEISGERKRDAIDYSPLYSTVKDQYNFVLTLKNIGYTIFTYAFKTPLLPGAARFLRLRIGPYPSSLQRNLVVKEALLSLFDDLFYNYEIVSPYDVCANFISKAAVYINGAFNETDVVYKRFSAFIKNMSASHVIYDDWRIVIKPNKLRRLRDIVAIGNIKVFSPLPGYSETPITKHQIRKDNTIAGSAMSFMKRRWCGAVSWYYRFFPYKKRCYRFGMLNNGFDWAHLKDEDRLESQKFGLYFSCKTVNYIRNVVLYLVLVAVFLRGFEDNIQAWLNDVLSVFPAFLAWFTTFAQENPTTLLIFKTFFLAPVAALVTGVPKMVKKLIYRKKYLKTVKVDRQ